MQGKDFETKPFPYIKDFKMPDYSFHASIMPLKSAAFNAAPPIRPPSTSGFAKSSLAFVGLQLPPY